MSIDVDPNGCLKVLPSGDDGFAVLAMKDGTSIVVRETAGRIFVESCNLAEGRELELGE